MREAQSSQILTANRLRTGAAVYWSGASWTDDMRSADVFAGTIDAEQALTAARKSVADQVVVNPYLFPVRIEAGEPQPLETRERIRAVGPSVRGDPGKQAHNPPARHV
jgi:hypothetical protein